MDANANANADAGGSTIALRELCSSGLKIAVIIIKFAFVNYLLSRKIRKKMYHKQHCLENLNMILKWARSCIMCLMPYANNKGADQPAHPCNLISTFVVRYLDSMICKLVISEVSRF